MLTKEDKTLIKNVCESKKYRVKRLIKDIPNKKWSKRCVEDFQKWLRTTGSIERAPGSGCLCTTRIAENVDAAGDLVQSQENQPPRFYFLMFQTYASSQARPKPFTELYDSEHEHSSFTLPQCNYDLLVTYGAK